MSTVTSAACVVRCDETGWRRWGVNAVAADGVDAACVRDGAGVRAEDGGVSWKLSESRSTPTLAFGSKMADCWRRGASPTKFVVAWWRSGERRAGVRWLGAAARKRFSSCSTSSSCCAASSFAVRLVHDGRRLLIGTTGDSNESDVEEGGVDTLNVLLPVLDGDDGRAEAVFAGRRVSPMLLRRSRLLSTATSRASYVLSPIDAAWNDASSMDTFSNVWDDGRRTWRCCAWEVEEGFSPDSSWMKRRSINAAGERAGNARSSRNMRSLCGVRECVNAVGEVDVVAAAAVARGVRTQPRAC